MMRESAPIAYKGRPQGLAYPLRTAGLSLCVWAFVWAGLGAQSEDVQDIKFEPYLKIVESQYFPPEKAGGRQVIRLKFDVSPDIPVGTKIFLQLLYAGLEEDQTVFELKNNVRKGVIFDWKPKKRLGVDKYTLFSYIPLAQQTPQVQEAFKKLKKRFPPKYEPWSWVYSSKEELITVGTPEEFEAQRKRIYEFYDGMVDALIESMNSFVEAMEEVKEGKRFVKGGRVDEDALRKYVKNWCKKQAGIQKAIKDIILEDPVVHQKTRTAYLELENLGRMVSKRGWNLQREVFQQYGLKPFQLLRDPKDKSDDVLMYFDRAWRYKVDKENLNRVLDRLYLKLENAVGPPPGEEPEGAEGEGAPSAKKEPAKTEGQGRPER